MKKLDSIALILAGVLIIAIVFFYIDKQSSESDYSQKNQYLSSSKNQSSQYQQQDSNKKSQNSVYQAFGCIGKGTVNFTFSPMKFEDINLIQPLGMMVGGHVTPTDHQYYYSYAWKQSQDYSLNELKDVYSPADGVVADFQIMPAEFKAVKNPELNDYRLVIYHTCAFYTIYIHLYWVPEKIKEALNKDGKSIQIKAGELIGKAATLDFSAHNNEITLNRFIVPEHYSGEPWKIHTVDPFDYFTEPLHSQLLEKNMRQAIPRGGKIDYDIDGKLIGNWFRENTGGYSSQRHGYGYWETHFAIVPEALDSEHIIISLGNYSGEAKQFAIKGNSPNPAEIGQSSGLVKYELVSYDYYSESTGQKWNRKDFVKNIKAKNNDNFVQGTVLLQLISDRKLKLEVFPNKTASQVSGFTDNALIYER